MKSLLLSSIAVGAMAFAGLAFAQLAFAQSAETVPTENLQKLSGMQATGTPMAAFQPVPQNDEYAAQLRKNLEQIKLPPGFKINLYAVVPDARHIAVGPAGRRHLRRHPQGRGVGDHRPQQGRRRRTR